MNELFLGKPEIFWIALQALGILTSNLILIFTGWFVYKQLRIAVKAFQFDGIHKMQELVDEFQEDRYKIFTTFPNDLIVSSAQFASYPSRRSIKHDISECECRRSQPTVEQLKAFNHLNKKQIHLAKKVIGKLNDLGQLAEDGFINYRVFLGKYHTMIIRLCYFLEIIRRKEEESQGGNYGQRLLRMRNDAMKYNLLSPKHRIVEIKIVTPRGSRVIVESIEGTFMNKVLWWIQRINFRYSLMK
jgi:hypothetical protein